MTNHPTGDTALARAITTGAPVATNDKQAAELTQRFNVGDRVKWKTLDDRFGSVRRVLSGEYLTVAWDGAIDAIEHAGNLELAPTPTLRPTPGGEWSFQGSDIVYEGKVLATAFSESVAYRIVRELNAADAMEAELAKVRKQRNQWILIADELAGMSADLLDALPSVPAVEAARNKLSRVRSMMNVSRRDQQ